MFCFDDLQISEWLSFPNNLEMMGAEDVKPEVEKITIKLVEQGNETTFQVKSSTLVQKVSCIYK